MDNQARAATAKPSDEVPLTLNDDSVVERLRASRVKYRQNLEIDAKKSGAEWLMRFASYEQIMFLYAVKAGKHKDGRELQLDNAVALFDEMDRQIPRVSKVAGWSRDDVWLEAFIDGALDRWSEISDKVENA